MKKISLNSIQSIHNIIVSHHTNKTYKLKLRLRPALYKDGIVFKDLKVSEMLLQVTATHYFTD